MNCRGSVGCEGDRYSARIRALADGVFDETGAFRPLEDPDDTDVERLLHRSARRILVELDDPTLLDELDATLLRAASERGQASFSFAPPPHKPLCARIDGFSLHAATRVTAWDRRELADGRFRYELKRPLHGRTEMVLTGVELVRKLAALITIRRVSAARRGYRGDCVERRPILPMRRRSRTAC